MPVVKKKLKIIYNNLFYNKIEFNYLCILINPKVDQY